MVVIQAVSFAANKRRVLCGVRIARRPDHEAHPDRVHGEHWSRGQGGPGSYTDPNFGYRYKNGSMTAGTLRVIFELGEVKQADGAT